MFGLARETNALITEETTMAFNFFEWVREGVKHSVLRGVSDAVETMGMPEDAATSRAKILKFLQEDSPATTIDAASETASTRRATGGQRKLGRSISDIHPLPPPHAKAS